MALSDPLDALAERLPENVRGCCAPLVAALPDGVRTPAGLVRIARDPEQADELRSSAILLLGRLAEGAHAVEVIQLLGDPSVPDDLRHDVTQAVQYCEDERVVTALHAALARDVVPLVRCSAANALGFNPSTRTAYGDIVEILLDTSDDPELRGFAAEALGHSFQTAALPPAVASALRTTVLDDDATVRAEAVWALGVVGRVRDIDLLERVLTAERERDHGDAEVMKACHLAIAEIAQRRRPRRTQKTGVSR